MDNINRNFRIMERRDFLKISGLAGIAVILGLAPQCTQPVKSPNILFIMTDQQPVSCVGVYNEAVKTPHLDKLARQGITFDNFYISGFPCSPSRASILTGRYPHNHGVIKNDIQLDPSIPTLGSICREAGYQTGYFGKGHLGGNMYPDRHKDPLPEKFTEYWRYEIRKTPEGWQLEKMGGGPGEDFPQLGFTEWAGGWRQYKDWLKEHGQDQFVVQAGNHDAVQSTPEGKHMFSRLGEEYHMAAFFAEKTEQFVRQHAKDAEPWAAVLSFFGPHLPVSPPKPWDTIYSLDNIPLPGNHFDSLEGKPYRQQNNDLCYVLPRWSDEQFKDYIRRYWGYCGYIDQQIGTIFVALQETGQWDNTIVIFTSDHGDMVGSHGMIWKLGTCGYEELFRVPAIIKVPGILDKNRHSNALAGNIDLLPTILEAAGIKLPGDIDGRSLIPIIKGTANQHRDIVFADVMDESIICRNEKYKFVLNWKNKDLDELYNLETDPGELMNLALQPEFSDHVKEMKEKVFQWTEEARHPYSKLIKQSVLEKD
ncbi:MAG: sulfatase-like hydrolase/transferase [Bacteroidetes bacterium]|nr:sulfatase-like hydrolase/transferase [Bacteroidota bacterium]